MTADNPDTPPNITEMLVGMMELVEQLDSVVAGCAALRAKFEGEEFSPTAAEQMAMELNRFFWVKMTQDMKEITRKDAGP